MRYLGKARWGVWWRLAGRDPEAQRRTPARRLKFRARWECSQIEQSRAVSVQGFSNLAGKLSGNSWVLVSGDSQPGDDGDQCCSHAVCLCGPGNCDDALVVSDLVGVCFFLACGRFVVALVIEGSGCCGDRGEGGCCMCTLSDWS